MIDPPAAAHRPVQALAPPLIALYLVSNLLVRSFSDIWLFIGWTALCFAVILAPRTKGPRPIFYALVLLLASHALAIPGSLLWGTGNWELTAGVLLWMAPAVTLYLVDLGLDIFLWLIPAWLAHTGLMIWQGFTNWTMAGDVVVWSGQPTGLANNANISAGFLSLGIVYLLTTPYRWLALPMLMALLFTGSRWGILVTAVVLVSMAAAGAISWRPLLGTAGAVVLGVMCLGMFTPHGYAVAGINSFAVAVHAATVDVGTRLAIPHIPTFLPSGVAEHPGLHNVPLRMAVENGIAAAVLWLGITGWALLFTPTIGRNKSAEVNSIKHPIAKPEPNTVHRWLLLTLVLLSVLDYYTWMGHLGGFWWLLIGLLVKAPSPRLSTAPTPASPSPASLTDSPGLEWSPAAADSPLGQPGD